MKTQIDRFLEKAAQFEGKADKAENPILKLTYKELARDYRTLAEHAERAQGLGRIEAIRPSSRRKIRTYEHMECGHTRARTFDQD